MKTKTKNKKTTTIQNNLKKNISKFLKKYRTMTWYLGTGTLKENEYRYLVQKYKSLS